MSPQLMIVRAAIGGRFEKVTLVGEGTGIFFAQPDGEQPCLLPGVPA